MTYKLGIERRLHQFLSIILVLGTIERTDAMCGKPGRTPFCRHDDVKEEYEVDEQVKYICSQCETLDTKVRRCLQNGTWSGRIPVCHAILQNENIHTVSILNPERGMLFWANFSMDRNIRTCSSEVLEYKTYWRAVLHQKFKISMVKLNIIGPAILNTTVLIKEGQKPAKTCGYYSGLITGDQQDLIFPCFESFLGNTVLIFQNNQGFRLCEVSLYLAPGIQSCVRPDSPHMGIGSKQISDSKTYTLDCKADYELVGNNIVVCQPNGTWTESSAMCKRKSQCRSLPSISNGFLRANATSVNSVAFLECDTGYKPVGVDRIYCLPTGEWTSKTINCEAIQCDSKPTIHHGKGVLLNNSTYLGSKLHIICDHGYTARETELRQCHENATWGNLNICIETNCGPLSTEATTEGKWVALNGTTSIRVLLCETGYYIEGSPAVIQCLPNGSWSYTTSVCKRTLLNDEWKSEWVPSTILMSAVAVGAGTAICIVCLVLSFLVLKNRKQSKSNTTVFHVGVTDSSIYTDRTTEQFYKNPYEEIIELRHSSFTSTPRKPSSALPHIPIDTDPVYAQPFETVEVERTATVNTTDIYTAHIYAEPVDSHKPLQANMYSNVAETWLKSGAKRFGRKMSLPGRSSLSEDLVVPTSPNIAVCKPVIHSSNINSMNANVDETFEKTDFKDEQQSKLGLINNSLYSSVNDKSFTSFKDIEHFQMIDNEIYQDDYFTNV